MIATSHVIIGGAAALAVGSLTHNPLAGLAAGVVSHLICDALPHLDGPIRPDLVSPEEFEKNIWKNKGFLYFAILDSLIAFFSTLGIWYLKFKLSLISMFAWGAFGGYLVDLVDNFPLWRNQIHKVPFFKQFHEFHKWIHNNWRQYFPEQKYWLLGIITQLVLVLPCLYYLIK